MTNDSMIGVGTGAGEGAGSTIGVGGGGGVGFGVGSGVGVGTVVGSGVGVGTGDSIGGLGDASAAATVIGATPRTAKPRITAALSRRTSAMERRRFPIGFCTASP